MKYEEFIHTKTQEGADRGFEPLFLPDCMFDFQKFLAGWTIRKGRCAEFADCGLGKTLMQLVWAENMVRKTGARSLILTPLAVGPQTVREAHKFGMEAHHSRDGSVKAQIVVTNYEQLHLFSPEDFGSVVCDESSILKSFDGTYRNQITDFMRKVPYRLLCTATAAPNDYIELGTSSEALGFLGHMDMLNKFFRNDQDSSGTKRYFGEAPKWRFKGHAELSFWRWVCSWARAVRKPSDLGFDDGAFILPKLTEIVHKVRPASTPNGYLMTPKAVRLEDQRREAKRTIRERCEKAAALADHKEQVLLWCHRNEEGDLLEELIPESVQISGADSDQRKEDSFGAFANGEIRALITKPKIGAWGLNFQNCHRIVVFPSHSYEQYYQAVRRCWRFGQKSPVTVDIITTDGEQRVLENLQRKAQAADVMFSRLVEEMNWGMKVENNLGLVEKEEIPSWL